MIDVKNISVCKSNRNIIDGISCQMESGKIIVVVGKNGAGKSTLMEALTGTNDCCQGEIRFDGQVLSDLSVQSLAQRRAVLSQSVNINFPIKVYDLIETGTYVADDPICSVKTKNIVEQALKEVGLEDFIYRDYNTLSGGEKKRIMLAKCLVQLNCCHWADIPKYLFLDEPTAGLDIEQQHKLIELVKGMVKRRNFGVFAILHDLDLAARFADEILWMKDGKIIASGTPEMTMTEEIIYETLGVYAIVQEHPVFGCPHVITVPGKAVK
ncbi:MAG: iron complex transport system ATP-binding protein [Saprospiraceae bacterium]|jgi:iron complex transport system ATP-binding protein